MLTSLDAGVTWQKHDSGTQFDLHGVWFADARRGWAVGADGTLVATADGGATWQSRDTGTTSPFLHLASAGPARHWAAGGDGSVLSIAVPNTASIVAAGHLTEMRAALRSIDVSEATVGQPLNDFAAADADLMERSAKVERERETLKAEPPSPPPPQAPPESNMAVTFHDPLFLASVNRIVIALYVVLTALSLGAVVRRAMRLSMHVDACADALILCNGVTGDRFLELARTLTGAKNLDSAIGRALAVNQNKR